MFFICIGFRVLMALKAKIGKMHSCLGIYGVVITSRT